MPCAGADTGRPSIATEPASGCTSPAISRNVVVLPQPLGPSSTTNSPSATSSDKPSTAARAP
jgi:hypothetical protein